MERAIAAARRAFDETDWSTDRAFRKACLQQLKDALDKHTEDAAAADRRRGRHADRAHVRDPAGHLHRRHAVGHRPASTATSGSTSSAIHEFFGMQLEPARRPRADRRRRRDHAVELPVHAQPLEDHARARRRLHGHPEARARHAVRARRGSASSSPRRPTSRRACSTSSRRATRPRSATCSPATRAST